MSSQIALEYFHEICILYFGKGGAAYVRLHRLPKLFGLLAIIWRALVPAAACLLILQLHHGV